MTNREEEADLQRRSYTTSKLRLAGFPWQSSKSLYDIFNLFFDAYDLFLDIFEKYEERVQRSAEEHGCHRSQLIDLLKNKEISALFDFDELIRLRLEYLRGFLDLTNEAFLEPESPAVKGFMIHIKHVYHLLSILALEELNVSVIAPAYEALAESENLKELLREVDREFPTKLREIRAKFEQAFRNLDGIIPSYRHDRIFCRSVYLFERDRMARYYGDIDAFYLRLYPTGLLGGLRLAAEEFHRSGFEEITREVLVYLKAEIDRRGGKEPFAKREGFEGDWRRFRALYLQFVAEDGDAARLV